MALIDRVVFEDRDVMLDPLIGLMQRLVPVYLSELGHKVLR